MYNLIKEQFKSYNSIEAVLNSSDYLYLEKDIDIENMAIVNICYPDKDHLEINNTNQFKLKIWDIEKDICNYSPMSDKLMIELFKFVKINKTKKFIMICDRENGKSLTLAILIEYFLNNGITDKYIYLEEMKKCTYIDNFNLNNYIYNRFFDLSIYI